MRFGRRGARASKLPSGSRLAGIGAQLTDDKKRFERALAFGMRAAGFPPFEVTYRYARPRKITADMAFIPFRLLIEVQGGIWKRGGGAHSHPLDVERDIEKMQEAVYGRWFVLPVTTDQVTDGRALVIIEKALLGLGWERE